MGSLKTFSTAIIKKMQKSLLCLVLIASLLIAAEAAAVPDANELAADGASDRFGLLAFFAFLRCRATCAAVNYVSTTSCTLITSTFACNFFGLALSNFPTLLQSLSTVAISFGNLENPDIRLHH